MILLLILLMTGMVKLHWIEETASFLNKHLGFFFIPICVGLMTMGPFLLKNGFYIISILLLSTSIGIIASGWFTQLFAKDKRKERGASEYRSHGF